MRGLKGHAYFWLNIAGQISTVRNNTYSQGVDPEILKGDAQSNTSIQDTSQGFFRGPLNLKVIAYSLWVLVLQ